jgi:hypothetical protein
MAWITVAYANTLPPVSGVISIATEPVAIKTTSVDGKVTNRTVGVGQPIYLNDEIKTGPNNKLQILLKDQTVFNVGPNSVMTIDKFVFDPTKGELSVGIQKGAFKFVSGKVSNSNPEAMKVKLPNATISVRGTGVAGNVAPDGASTVVLLHGVVDVAGAAGTSTLSKSGWGVQVAPGGVVGQPTVIPPEITKGIMGSVAQIKSGVTTQVAGGAGSTTSASSSASSLAGTELAKDSTSTSSTSTNSSSLVTTALPSIVKPVISSTGVVTPATITSATQSSNARSLAYGLSTLPTDYLALIPQAYQDYLRYLGYDLSSDSTTADSSSGGSSSGPSADLLAVDAYLSTQYPIEFNAGAFNVTQKLGQIASEFDSFVAGLPANNANFSGFTIEKVNDLKTFVRNPSSGPIGTFTFTMPIPGLSTGFTFNCATSGISCGYSSGGNILSHVVRLNYDAATLSNTYLLSYTFGGLGTSVAQQTKTLAGSATANFSQLAGSTSGNVITLPKDPSHTTLTMLATFFKSGSEAYRQGVFSTTVAEKIGANSTIVLQGGYSANGYCSSGAGTCR